jgi:hypothetical protein
MKNRYCNITCLIISLVNVAALGLLAGCREESKTSDTLNSRSGEKADVLAKDVSQSVDGLFLPEMNNEYIDTVLKIPEHKWQKERSGNIKGETLEQLIANFANFDDMHLAVTSDGIYGTYTDSRSQNLVVTRLARVRKVMKEGQIFPEKVIPLLQESFKNAIDQWPKTALESKQNFMALQKQGKGYFLKGPDLFRKYQTQALAATYLLAELGSHDSLSLMLKCYKIHDYENKNQSPVPPGTILYAMHRLLQSFPDKELSPQARDIRENYLEMTSELLPPPEEITVTQSWHSKYDESDPRIQIVDPEKNILIKESTMKMAVYPYRFIDGTRMARIEGKESEKTKLLFEELERFIEAAYPKK